MPQIGIHITHELHRRICDAAEEQNISVSDFVRPVVERMLHGCQPSSTTAHHEKFTQHIERQLQGKDEQI
jgi:hypothetical protein